MTTAIEAAATSGADWTIREIAQQPAMWRETLAIVDSRRAELNAWLAPLLARRDLRIVLTGAGTSAFAGRMIAPALSQALGRVVEAIATTDIVANPVAHLLPDVPLLLVSFARSGSSPESIAAVELAERLVTDCHHLAVCCNGDSGLCRAVDSARDGHCLLMPPATLDRSFAMTSSLTSMVMATLALIAPDAGQATTAIAAAERLLASDSSEIAGLVRDGLDRVVFLGSGGLHGAATEAALKCLELSAGETDCFAESSLGLRHGPKFVVAPGAVIVSLVSGDAHTRRYDIDMIDELRRDAVATATVRLDELAALTDVTLDDHWRALVYLVWCQLLAYRNALAHGVFPDNPSPGGQVNRVVRGVTIHPFNACQPDAGVAR